MLLPRLPLRLAGGGGTVLHCVFRSLCTTAPLSKPPPEPLSPSDLDAISALLPRLISEGRVPAAGRLLSAALLLPDSPERLPFSPLVAHLASMPTLTLAFALLTAIRHHPVTPRPCPSPPRSSAASVLRWLCHPNSPHRLDDATYAIAVAVLYRPEDPKNVLVVFRDLAADGVQPSRKLWEAVRGAMLQDTRIEEEWALEEAMLRPEFEKLVELVNKLLGGLGGLSH